MKGDKGCDDFLQHDFPMQPTVEEEGVNEYENEYEYDTAGLWGHNSDIESRGETKDLTSEPCHNNQDIVQVDNT
jgi:hypothetical protein